MGGVVSDSGSTEALLRRTPALWRCVVFALNDLRNAERALAEADPLTMLAARDRRERARDALCGAMLRLFEVGLVSEITRKLVSR